METCIVNFDVRKGEYSTNYKGKKFSSSNMSYIRARVKQMNDGKLPVFKMAGRDTQPDGSPKMAALDFNINTRFTFLEKLVRMVADKHQASVIITGDGGLGKSYTVKKTLEAAGYVDTSLLDGLVEGSVLPKNRFVTVKGYSTAKGLFRLLYNNKDNIVVFDDCDSILKDKDALNIFKGALDSYGRRVITWNAESKDEDLPPAFEFKGFVIFISNINMEDLDLAIRTRSMCVDVSMTAEQKIERMAHIAESAEFMPEYDKKIKQDALALIKKNVGRAREISLRTLISVSKIRHANPSDWQDLATYMLCH